jgi:thioredoxin:protein disulfide reductase
MTGSGTLKTFKGGAICLRMLVALWLVVMASGVTAAPSDSALSGFFDRFAPSQSLLPAERAFQFSARLLSHSTIEATWRIAPGYYLYRGKFEFELSGAGRPAIAARELPHGLPHDDPEFGTVEIFRDDLVLTIPLTGSLKSDQVVEFTANFQGCADRGVCYPPMTQTVKLDPRSIPEEHRAGEGLTAKSQEMAGECSAKAAEGFVDTGGLSEQCSVVQTLKEKDLWPVLLSFLGMGVLLSLTPCVFPMIPILSGIIVGQGERLTAMRGFFLSLSYVVASALSYMVFGVIAGLFGENLQVYFQSPWVIATFSGFFVVLALSMFGVFQLEVPRMIQERVALASRGLHGGTMAGAALMGALSSLIVGPCVAAPLAGVLIYIGESGDAVLGGIALFALGLGMGVPLLLIGLSAGKLLPKAGSWMEGVTRIFGVGMVATALWLLGRVLPGEAMMLLSGAFLIILATYLRALDSLPSEINGWFLFRKGVGLVLLIYGGYILMGLAEGQTDLLFPLKKHQVSASATEQVTAFKRVGSVHELERALEGARLEERPVLLDVYADWCISCKEMERYTFEDPNVAHFLRKFELLRADVTANSAADKALLERFHLIGPPAVIFFGVDGQEKQQQRVIGFMDAADFIANLHKVAQ